MHYEDYALWVGCMQPINFSCYTNGMTKMIVSIYNMRKFFTNHLFILKE